MIIEELIAKLGFKADGLGDLKKYETGLKNASKSLDRFGTAANKALGKFTGGAFFAGLLPKVSAGAKALGSGMLVAAGWAAKAALNVAMITTGAATAVAAVWALAKAFVAVAANAAKARREQQIMAKASKTTARDIDDTQKGLNRAAASDVLKDQAKEIFASLNSKINDAIEKKDYKTFKEHGINPLDGEKNQRNTKDVFFDIVAKLMALQDRAKIASTKAAGEDVLEGQQPGRGHKRKAQAHRDQRDAAQAEARRLATTFGLSNELVAVIAEFKGSFKNLIDMFEAAKRDNPSLNKEQEAAREDLARQWTVFLQKLAGIIGAILPSDRWTKSAGEVLTQLDALANGIIDFLKKMGMWHETDAEVAARKREIEKVDEESPEIQKAREAAGGESAPRGPEWFFGTALANALKNYEAAKAIKKDALENRASPEALRRADERLSAAGQELIEAAQAQKAKAQEAGKPVNYGSSDGPGGEPTNFGAALDRFRADLSPLVNLRKMEQNVKISPIDVKGETTVKVDPIKVTVEASPELKASAATVKAGAKNMKIQGHSGAAVVKGSNAGTLGAVTP